VRDPASPDEQLESAAVPRRVWLGTALSIAGRLWGSLCTMALLALCSRRLGGPEFGRLTFYLALFALLDALVDFGTSSVALQRAAQDPPALGGVLAAGRALRLRLALGGLVLVAGLALFLGEPGAGFIVLASLYPLTHVYELSAIVFRNQVRLGVPVVVRAAAAMGRLAAAAALSALGVPQAAPYLAATALASALANGLLHALAKPHLPKGVARAAPGMLAAAWPLGIAGLFQQAYFHIDNLFVRGLAGLDELGVYNAGVRLLSVLILCAQFAPAVGLPWLARRAQSGDLASAAARLGQPLFALGGLIAGLCFPLRAQLLVLLFGEPFRAGAAAFGWLLGAVALVHAGAPLVSALVAGGRSRAVLAVTGIGLSVNLAANALLVPARGAEGAGIATLLTELAVAVGAALALSAGSRPGRRAAGWLGGPLAFGLGAGLGALLAQIL
jgi:O-antigen/teichoic acid export membrane protein